jgi:hypothetical protein
VRWLFVFPMAMVWVPFWSLFFAKFIFRWQICVALVQILLMLFFPF